MITLVTGGSKNGKSHIAESIAAAGDGPRIYIATMEPFGAEAQAAIKRHRQMRAGKGFLTIEQYTNIQELVVPNGSSVLLECIGNLCANEMFSSGEIKEDVAVKLIKGITQLASYCRQLVIVTSQVGDDGIRYPKETMAYIRQMGRINAALAAMADRVIEAVYGIPVVIKG